jgi:hypothetical protein
VRGTPRRPSSWLADLPRRARLEAPARAAYPTLRYRRKQRHDGPVHIYNVDVPVPGYGNRHVTLEFRETSPWAPHVYADGPAGWDASPHRFAARGDRRLCIWHGGDDAERCWVPADGLLSLLGMAAHHLFKEAWWRETGGRDGGEWLGDEYPHGELTDADDPARGAPRP